MPLTAKFPYRPDLHAKCVEVAMAGKTITYRELGTSRAMVGRYLDRINHEEALAGRPPLSAVVVRSGEGRPGPGFREAVEETGFLKPGETDLQVWKRALVAVHEYWRPKLDEDDHDGWPTMKS